MQFTRTNILTDTPGGKSMSSGGIILEGNQGGSGGDYIHPTGWLWGNKYTGRETLDGDLTSNGTIKALNVETTNLISENGDITNLDVENLVADNGDINYLNVLQQLNAWGADIDHATIRDLFVSGSAHFVELIIDKINSTDGSLILSPAHATITRVEELNGLVYCYFPASDGEKEISNDFDIDDLVICQSFNVKQGYNYDVGNKFIWKRVVGKGTVTNDDSDSDIDFVKEHYFVVKKTDFSNANYSEYMHPSTNSEFELGDVVCTLGNWTKTNRQKAILMTATNSKWLDIGNVTSSEMMDKTYYANEAYLRTAPIGVCNDMSQIDNNVVTWMPSYPDTILDLGQLNLDDIFDTEGTGADTNYYIKDNAKFVIKFRPHWDDESVFDVSSCLNQRIDKNMYPNGPYFPGTSTYLYYYTAFGDDTGVYRDDVIFKLKDWVVIRRRRINASEGYQRFTYTLYKNDRAFPYWYKVRDLDIKNGEIYNLILTSADNTYDINSPWSYQSLNIGHICYHHTTKDYLLLADAHGWWWIDTQTAATLPPTNLKNEVYDYYACYTELNGVKSNENKPLLDVKTNYLKDGELNGITYWGDTNTYWNTNMVNSAVGYDNPVNEKECVEIYRPNCKEVYVWQGTEYGCTSGKYLECVEPAHNQNGWSVLSFDYWVNNDNQINNPDFYFRVSVTCGTDTETRIIRPDKLGVAHKCVLLLNNIHESHDDRDNFWENIPSNTIWFIGEDTTYKVKFDTDVCGNQNQLIIDNIRITKNSFWVYPYPLPIYTGYYGDYHYPSSGHEYHSTGQWIIESVGAILCDTHTFREYKYVVNNPIDAPAIITFNNINRFSLADKHVSVLSPTYNLISASSVSGLDTITSSISSLSTRVTNCETNIETNASQIALKADKSTVNTLTGEVNDLSSQLLIQAGEISSAVTSISNINGEITQLDTRITQNATAISLQATAITSLNDSVSSLSSELTIQAGQISSLVSSVSSIDGEVVSLWSSITQLPDEISAYVYEEIGDELQRTGIDITNGTIVLDATKTDITGDLTLSDADQGVAIQNQGVDKILIQNSSLGTVDDFDFGADRVISNSVSNITCPDVLTYSIELGNLSATTPLNIENINFNAWQTNGDVNYLEGYSYTYTLKCDGSSVTSVNGNVVFGNQGHNTVFMTSLNISSLPSTGAYTLDFSISNMQYTSALSGNISYSYFIKVKSVSPGINRISLDGAVFSSDTTKYNWFGADKSVIRRDNSQLVVTNQGIYRTSLNTEYFSVQNGMPIGDISTTIPIRRVYDQTYTATEKDGLITFNYSLNADGNRRTLTLPNPRRIVEGKWFMVKNNVNDNTIVTSPPYDQWSQTDLIIPEDSTTPVETYQCGNKSMKFVSDGWQWIAFYCG